MCQSNLAFKESSVLLNSWVPFMILNCIQITFEVAITTKPISNSSEKANLFIQSVASEPNSFTTQKLGKIGELPSLARSLSLYNV